MIKSDVLASVGNELLALAERERIPYAAGGGTLDGMDCQGLIEYLLMQCGIKRNWRGSNDMWRNALKWSGTPEAFVQRFGALPEGAAVFIVLNDGGEPDDYKRTDVELYGGSKGNASHVGLWLGYEGVLHASASVGKVCKSVKFDGIHAVPNGGFNAVGLWADVMYSEDIERELAVGGEAGDNGGAADAADWDNGLGADVAVGAAEGLTGGTPVETGTRYAAVVSPDGNPVKLRKSKSANSPGYAVYWHVNPGARVRVERVKGDWTLITAICSDGHTRRAYMMSRFLRG